MASRWYARLILFKHHLHSRACLRCPRIASTLIKNVLTYYLVPDDDDAPQLNCLMTLSNKGKFQLLNIARLINLTQIAPLEINADTYDFIINVCLHSLAVCRSCLCLCHSADGHEQTDYTRIIEIFNVNVNYFKLIIDLTCR